MVAADGEVAAAGPRVPTVAHRPPSRAHPARAGCMLRRVRYLSPEWIDAAGAALAAAGTLGADLADVTLTVSQVVEDGPDGVAAWNITIENGRATLAPGAVDDADVRFSTDYRTAAQIASGALAAQRAFVEGRLRVGGDLSLLITHQRAVARVDDALAPVRAMTTYA